MSNARYRAAPSGIVANTGAKNSLNTSLLDRKIALYLTPDAQF
tara:strand:- start:171 stop:299 length:129 start_codon:yes stop_codon:yes gene_type:complete